MHFNFDVDKNFIIFKYIDIILLKAVSEKNFKQMFKIFFKVNKYVYT